MAKKSEIIKPALAAVLFVIIAVIVTAIASFIDSITLGIFGLSIGLLATVFAVLSLRIQ